MDGMEEIGTDVESGVTMQRARYLADAILNAPETWQTSLATSELAAACAQLDVQLDEEQESIKGRKAALNEARRILAERFTAEGISQVRVDTTMGRRLVHLASVFAPSVPAEKRAEVVEWLKKNHPELVSEQFSDATLRAKLRQWQSDSEGEFPQALVDAGTIKVYAGVEVRFRKS